MDPPLPAHFGCYCSYMMTDAEATYQSWDWDKVDYSTLRKWIQIVAQRLRDGLYPPVPFFLLPLLARAIKYNKEEYVPRPPPPEEEPEELSMSTERLTLNAGHIRLEATGQARRYAVTFIEAGKNKNNWTMPIEVLGQAVSMFDGVPCLLNHAGLWKNPDIEKWGATHENPILEGNAIKTTLRIANTEAGDRLERIFSAWLADTEAGLPTPPIGLSADLSVKWQPRDDYEQPRICAEITRVWSGDAVLFPAAGGKVEHVLNSILPGGNTMSEEQNSNTPAPVTPPATPVPVTPPTEVEAPASITALQAQVATLTSHVESLAHTLAHQTEDETVQGNGRSHAAIFGGESSIEEIQAAINWLVGVDNAPIPAPFLRRLDNTYQLLSGDAEWRGVFDPSRVHLATANASTLSDMVTDGMNKVIIQTYDTLRNYRWFETIVDVAPNDGSLQDMKWITFGGIGALPNVPYGSEYTELTVGDSKEADSFAVYGGYVGITRQVLP